MQNKTVIERLSPEDLDTNWVDRTKGILTSISGCIPIIGPVIQELFSSIIPNQRLNRIVEFLKQLDQDFQEIGKTQREIEQILSNPENSSLLYKACMGCADALSNEKIESFKNIFIYGLRKNIDFPKARAEAFLNLLTRLTDMELQLLKYFQLTHSETWGDQEAQRYLSTLGLKAVYKSENPNYEDDEDSLVRIKELSLNNLIYYGLIIENEIREGRLKIDFPLDVDGCFLSPIGELFISAITFDVSSTSLDFIG